MDVDRPSADDVERTWEVMRRFAAEPVEDAGPPEQDGDGILAQYGVYDWSGRAHFELDMTRQLIFSDDDGEYEGMSQLQCTFQFEATEELRALGEKNLWSFGLDRVAFFERALEMPGFRGVRELRPEPLRLVVDYSDV